MEKQREQELVDAKRAIDSLIGKSQKAQASLSDKDPIRYKGQVTLLKNRIKALEIAAELIVKERMQNKVE